MGTVHPGGAIGFHGGPLVQTKQASVTILERADDPSKDPIGTLRGGDGWLFVRRETRAYHIGAWATLISPPGVGAVHYNRESRDVADFPIVGVTPGTPADPSVRS